MISRDTFTRAGRVIRKNLGLKTDVVLLTDHHFYDDLGAKDELELAQLLLEIEIEFGIAFNDDLHSRIFTVGQLLTAIDLGLQASAGQAA